MNVRPNPCFHSSHAGLETRQSQLLSNKVLTHLSKPLVRCERPLKLSTQEFFHIITENPKIHFINIDLSGSDLRGIKLECTIEDSALDWVDLSGSDLHDAKFQKCNFSDSSFESVDLKHTIFIDCNFTNSNLSKADIRGLDIKNMNLLYADLIDTKIDPIGALYIKNKYDVLIKKIYNPDIIDGDIVRTTLSVLDEDSKLVKSVIEEFKDSKLYQTTLSTNEYEDGDIVRTTLSVLDEDSKLVKSVIEEF